MSEIDNIVSRERVSADIRNRNGSLTLKRGVVLTMKNGERWFHSDTGATPVKLSA